MSARSFLVLLATTVAAVILAVLIAVGRDLPATGSSLQTLLLPELGDRHEEIEQLHVVDAETTATITRTDDGWTLQEKDGYPVDFDRVQRLMLGLQQIRLIEEKTADASKLGRLDLGVPGVEGSRARKVDLVDANGEILASVIVGKTSYGLHGPDRSGSYVRLGGETQSYLADRELALPEGPRGWLNTSLLSLEPAQVSRIVLDVEADAIALARAPGGRWVVEQTPDAAPDPAPLDQEKVERLLDVIADLQFQEVTRADESLAVDRVVRFELENGGAVVLRVDAPAADEPEIYRIEIDAPESVNIAAPVAFSPPRTWRFEISRYLGQRLMWTREDLAIELPDPS